MDLKQISMMLFVLGLLLLATAYCVQMSENPFATSGSADKLKNTQNSAYYLSIAAVVFMWLGAAGGLFAHSGAKLQ